MGAGSKRRWGLFCSSLNVDVTAGLAILANGSKRTFVAKDTREEVMDGHGAGSFRTD
jgi:hypothetical protein